ncbi:hypothetical protein WR25_18208 [Diploscapter pachys]|uniref:Dynein heavy chain tail domain-containing protein n=1 Tax=Diploscapter pachys TaxID=2018661 RepID=A0A2A2L5R9_9BILA|nr:hypothetical protein WR25_18208 [Diploscapter pachys]
MDGDINGNTKEKDSRRSYLLRIASYILGLNITEEKLRQTQPLDSFCETATNLLVFARSEQKVELWNQMKPDMKGMNRVAFYKSQSIPLTPDNYKNIVNVVTMNGASPNEVFLKSVQNVFSKNITEQASPPKQLINVVNELEENLLATVEKGQGQGVSSLPDEIKYWKSVSGSTAQQYSDAFYPLQLIIDTLENRSIEELSSLVDAYEDTCDQLWNSQPPYPEGRMRGLLISMASYLSDQICTMIKEDEIWKDPKVEGQLRAAIAACEQWELAVKLLTGQTWRRQPDNEWKGEAVKLTMLEGFRKRLEEVLSLKLFAPQIGQLLSDKQAEKEVEKIVETTMKGTAALAYNPFTESNWRSRLMVAERAMEPLIERTIPVLKLRMQPNKRDFHNIPIDIERYRNFLCRAKIKEKLQAEREGLLTRVAEVVLAKESEINEKIAAENDGGGRFLSSIAASILFIRQQITLVESILYTTKGLLDDLPAYQKFQGHVTDLLEKCREMEREQFDNWCRETQQTIDDPADSIALETKGKIMILEQKKGTLNINYSDRLLKLLKEVRQLASLGLTIPAKIINVANNGEKFYRYGVTLKQIAHFYNTIDQQMLPCQQALMLDEAVAFEKLILPKKGNESTINKVTWEDPKQVEQFIQQLQEAEEKLANHNRHYFLPLNNLFRKFVYSYVLKENT